MTKPLAAIIISYIVSALVANGFVDPVHANAVTDLINQGFGLTIALVTTGYALHSYVHLHTVKKLSEGTTQVKTEVKSEVVQDSGAVSEPASTPEVPSAEVAPSASY